MTTTTNELDDTLDYRTYTQAELIEHLPAILFDILADNTEHHAKEAFNNLVWNFYADDKLVLLIGMDDNTTKRIEITMKEINYENHN